MGRKCNKVIYLLLLIAHHGVRADDQPLVLQKSSPYNHKEVEQPGLMSRIASWLYPFGTTTSEDQIGAEDYQGGPQYLPPPSADCNPCNNEPWVPIASNQGHNTVINFVPPSSHQEYGPPPNPHQYQDGFPDQSRDQYVPPELRPPPPPPHLQQQYVSPSQIAPQSIKFINQRPAKQQVPNLYLVENMKPPPQRTTYLRPVGQDYVPLGMNPPPLPGGNYHSLLRDDFGEKQPPSPPPSDSYGTPIIRGPNANYNRERPPPLEPLPLPNLSTGPVLPIYNQQDFHQQQQHYQDNLPSQDTTNVQVVPSIQVADFLSSIDHPINVIQSPLLDVNVNLEESKGFSNEVKLNENPIVVEDSDTHVAASVLTNFTVDDNHHGDEFRNLDNNNQHATSSVLTNFTDQHGDLDNHNQQPVNFSVDHHHGDEFRNLDNHNQEDANSNFIKEILQGEVFSSGDKEEVNKSSFTPPPMDFGPWQPSSWSALSTSMVPPPKPSNTWLYPVTEAVTKRPVQIIIPYISSKKPTAFDSNQGRKVPDYSTLLPLYSPPSSTEESVWTKFVQDSSLTTTTQVSNIRDLLSGTLSVNDDKKLPFDVISLQNHIDNWTQAEFSKRLNSYGRTEATKLVASKKIPDEYFTTPAYAETTDYEPAGSNREETKLDDDIESNLVLAESTTTVTEDSVTDKDDWNSSIVTVSPVTKEKVYIVTPVSYNVGTTTTPRTAWISSAPKIARNSTKFTVRVDPNNETSRDKLAQDSQSPLTVVFSEWPHLINNLQTTTIKPTSRHPLMGLMDLSSYTPPPNSTVQTISGHSKVATVVTPTTTTTKKSLVDSKHKITTLKIVTPSPPSS